MLSQRWNHQRDFYRPTDDVAFDPTRYEVAAISQDRIAKAFVLDHHYSSTYPVARWRFGMYERGELVGVAVFSVPAGAHVLANVFGDAGQDAIELGRFVLLDRVPKNGESWFLARAKRALRREGVSAILSFSDPQARTNARGEKIFGGHLGVIYQASSAVYVGQAPKRTIRLLDDGTVFSARAQQKIRSGDKGWRPASEILERAGAPTAPTAEGARREWLREWLPKTTRTLRHPGNHRYAFPIHRKAKPVLERQPFPKLHQLDMLAEVA